MSRPKVEIEKELKRLLPKRSALLIAVSGGKDSVALLHAASELKDVLKLKLGVAHVDHGLRKNSKNDAEFVKKLCNKYKCEFYHTRLKKPVNKINIENWGRIERYKFFKKILTAKKYDWILTAHTANDVAETFLIRLVSNKELKSIEFKDAERKLLRPLLGVETDEILSYLKRNKVKFAEDETNKEDIYLRNKIRNKLIPLLRRDFDKRIVETISERSRALQEDIKGLNAMIDKDIVSLSKLKFGSKEWLKAAKKTLSQSPDFLSWRLAEGLVKPLLGYNLGRSKSKEVLNLLCGKVQGLELPGGIALRLRLGGVTVVK